MIWPFKKRDPDTKYGMDMMRAAAEGAERARLGRALATLGIKIEPGQDDDSYCMKAVIGIVEDLAKASGQTPIWRDQDRRFTAGIFAFTLANAVTFRLAASFEVVAAAAALIVISPPAGPAPASDVDDIASNYNDMTQGGRVIEAIGTTFSKWLVEPTQAKYERLVKLYAMLGASVGNKA